MNNPKNDLYWPLKVLHMVLSDPELVESMSIEDLRLYEEVFGLEPPMPLPGGFTKELSDFAKRKEEELKNQYRDLASRSTLRDSVAVMLGRLHQFPYATPAGVHLGNEQVAERAFPKKIDLREVFAPGLFAELLSWMEPVLRIGKKVATDSVATYYISATLSRAAEKEDSQVRIVFEADDIGSKELVLTPDSPSGIVSGLPPDWSQVVVRIVIEPRL